MNKSILSWFHQHSANYPLIEKEIIERDNRFPNIVSDSIIIKTSDENIHRFERFSNEDSSSRKKYLETATSPRRKGGGEERLARAWVINGIDHAPIARSNGGWEGVEDTRTRERKRKKTFGNLLDLAQRIDICSWNVLEAKVSPRKIYLSRWKMMGIGV